jgi:predicted nucleotidyltransferase
MDIKLLLKQLNQYNVRYVIIGATAGVAHGFTRLTSDITEEEAKQKKLLFRGYVLQTDIHPFVKGVNFDDVWAHKVQYNFQGETAYFSSLDDLIKMKKSAGRTKDLEDLQYLEEIKKQRDG